MTHTGTLAVRSAWISLGTPRRGALLTAVLGLAAAHASGQGLSWIQQHGTAATDGTWAVAPDGVGGGFAAGERGGYPFAPEEADAFVIRHGPAGNLLWERRLETPWSDKAYAAASDGSGGLFVAGFTNGSLAAPSGGQSDVWYARFDAAGNARWIRQLPAPSIQVAHGAASDGAGGVYLAGSTTGAFGGTHAGMADIWLGRFESDGDRVWMRQFGSSQADLVHDAASAPDQGVFVCGETYGDLVHPSAGGIDAWLARYDGLGNALWVRQIGTAATDIARAIASDGDDGVFVVGTTLGSLGGPAAGVTDAWIARYDGLGNPQWLLQLGTNDVDTAVAVVPDGLGGLYVAGDSGGDLGGASLGSNDVWIARFDGLGVRTWMSKFGSSEADLCVALALDGDGGFLLGGSTAGDLGAPGLGDFDAWTARFAAPCGVVSAYCTASATSIAGCVAAIDATGTPSLSAPAAFTISSGPVPGGNLGLCIFGASGSAGAPFGTLGGKLCLQGPIFRTAPKASGGSSGQCDGSLAFTLADLIAASSVVTSGATIHAQVWARYQANQDGFLLSDGLELVVCP
jgi:hypothetical protein